MIYDSLVHATPTGEWFGTGYDASAGALFSQIREHHVDKVVLSGLVQEGVNDFILECYAEAPNVIYPLPVITPQDFSRLQGVLKSYYEVGVRGVKIHPRWLRISFQDPRLNELFELCQQYRFTLFICTVPYYEIGDPPFIDQLLSKCLAWPELKIVFLHGGYYHLLELAERVRPYENILIDLSATLARFYDSSIGLDIKYLLRNFDKRISVGTDFPEYSYNDVRRALEYLDFSWEKAAALGVLGENLDQFIG